MRTSYRIRKYFVILAVSMACGFEARAENLEDEITGFVLDRTITRVGHEFARHLSDFRTMQDLGDYNLTVYERPSARWGNLIWVESNGDRVFQAFLPPSTSDVPAIAEKAASAIHQEVQRQKIQYLFSDRHDLAEDEF